MRVKGKEVNKIQGEGTCQINPLLSRYLKIRLRYMRQGASFKERHRDLSLPLNQIQSSQLSGMKEVMNRCRSCMLNSPFCFASFLSALIFMDIVQNFYYF